MSGLASFAPLIAPKAESWIQEQRDRHLEYARPLTNEERQSVGSSYSDDLLSRVRIREVQRVENPPFYTSLKQQASWLGVRIGFDFETVSGMTFDNCILIRQGELSPSLLFHELVHVAQYQQLGITRFAQAYVRGFAENNFVYEDIPLEAIAYRLTSDWEAGQSFSVHDQLEAWIRERGY